MDECADLGGHRLHVAPPRGMALPVDQAELSFLMVLQMDTLSRVKKSLDRGAGCRFGDQGGLLEVVREAIRPTV